MFDWLRLAWMRLRGALTASRVDDDFRKELESHLELMTEEFIRRGMRQDEARRQARVRLGGMTQLRETNRRIAGLPLIEAGWQDLRYAARLARKDPGYTLLAILALAIGIGANTALFTLFGAVALKPLPVPHPAELVSVWRTTPAHPRTGTFSFADYEYFRDRNSVFARTSAESPAGFRLSAGPAREPGGADEAEPVAGLFVTSNYFETFGVRPIVGRDFQPQDDQLAVGPYPVLLSDNYWDRRFGRDPTVVGKRLVLSGIPVTVVGITPRNFMGTRPEVPDVWIILSARSDPQGRARDRATLCCAMTGRLKPGATLKQTQSDLAVLADSLKAAYAPSDRQWTILSATAAPFGPNHDNIVRMFVVLQIAMALVLAIACMNVAGLFLGKAAARHRETAVRLSIGATRARVVRQFVTEGLLTAIVAGSMALLVSWLILAVAERAISTSLALRGDTLVIDVTPDLRVHLYALVISVVAGVCFALAPALRATGVDLTAALKDDRTGFGIRRRVGLHRMLVTAQIAVCLALLIGAGLLTTSSARLLAVDPGFETRSVLQLTIFPPQKVRSSAAGLRELRTQLETRLTAIPGVASLTVVNRVPLGGNVTGTQVVTPPNGSSPVAAPQQFPYSYVSESYFQTLGIPLLSGRTFTTAEIDGSAPVVIVSNALTQRLWPGADAVGRYITVGSSTEAHGFGESAPRSTVREVIGVARDIYSGDLTSPDPGALYLPQPQDAWHPHVLVRITGDPGEATRAIARDLAASAPGATVSIQTLRDAIVSQGLAAMFQISAAIFSAIGLVGFALASVGVYAMVGCVVSQQTHEVGIRMALGAQAADVVWLLIKDTSKSVAMGLLLGALLGAILARLLSSRLFLQGTQILDPLVVVGISLVIGGLALLASWFPVRRATRLDPATTLRLE